MPMNIDGIEEGESFAIENNHNNPQQEEQDSSPAKAGFSAKVMKWGLLILSCTLNMLGLVVGPLLLRLYFLHGGSRKWLSSWLQMAGFPILTIPLAIFYLRRDRKLLITDFFASRKLLVYAALIGLIYGIVNFMFCYGLSYLPVSTWSLLVTTQLVFTSLVSFVWVKQKFTPYTMNAIVVIIMGCILLGIRRAGDRLPGVTNSQYLLGFFITVGAASILGFIMVSTQVAYAKANQAMTYPIVLQFQVWVALFATLSCTIGGLVNRDFSAIHREASVMSATFLPISQIAAVITFHESFTAEKGMSLALTLWGFTSYFYGSYKKIKKETP